jgi:hypothetical protein
MITRITTRNFTRFDNAGLSAGAALLARPYQDMLVGQGKAGEILRNLLLEVSEQKEGRDWKRLVARVQISTTALNPP